MLAVRRVGSDGGPLPAVAVRGSGSGLPAEESPEEKRYTFMKIGTHHVYRSEGSTSSQDRRKGG